MSTHQRHSMMQKFKSFLLKFVMFTCRISSLCSAIKSWTHAHFFVQQNSGVHINLRKNLFLVSWYSQFARRKIEKKKKWWSAIHFGMWKNFSQVSMTYIVRKQRIEFWTQCLKISKSCFKNFTIWIFNCNISHFWRENSNRKWEQRVRESMTSCFYAHHSSMIKTHFWDCFLLWNLTFWPCLQKSKYFSLITQSVSA